MKGSILAASVALALTLGCQANAQDAALERRIDAILEAWNPPSSAGCAVGVARAGHPVTVRAVGKAELEHDIPITSDTVSEAGSVSKQFVAAAVLLLVQDGKMKLSDDVHHYLPELPDYGATITIDHLLTHTSGLRDWGTLEARAGWPRTTRIYTLADVLDIAARQKALNHVPGTEFSYTNTGYSLLAIIVQRVTGRSLAQFSEERLFAPLGLTHTQWRDDFRRVVKNRAVAYQKGPDGYRQQMPFENAHGNGGLLTTVGDLLRWNEALDAGRLGAFVTTQLQQPAVLNDGRRIGYARGLFVGNYLGFDEVSHSGSTAGYRAWLGRFPQARLSIALLCNAADVNPTDVAHEVADVFLEPATAVAVPSVALSAATAARRAGVYVNESTGSTLTLVQEGQALRIQDGPQLTAHSDERFEFWGNELLFNSEDRFQLRDALDGGMRPFKRAAPFVPAPEAFAQYTGLFASPEAAAAYVALIDHGKLVLRVKDHPESRFELSPVYPDVFEFQDALEGDTVWVRYVRNKRGKIDAFSMISPRVRDLRFLYQSGFSAEPPSPSR